MSKQTTKSLVPKRRFPEFQDAGEWAVKPLKKAFTRVKAKNTENNLNVLTISAQLGLVSQLDYFNKSVSAKDVTGYYLLRKGDFAYNKSYSKGYPMGVIKPLKGYEKGVVSTLYICLRPNNGYNESFYEQYFDAGMLNNEIGKIAQEGGRNHGLLNVGVNDFFDEVYLHAPPPDEQQKIADCLSSIDILIATHTQKHEALQSYKKGLMQNLFPAEGETVPSLRFPEFERAREWNVSTIDDIASISSGGTPSRSKSSYWGGQIPWVSTTLIDFNKIIRVNEFITESGLNNSSTKVFSEGTILMAMYGQGKTRGKVAVLGIKAAINQACAAITLNEGMNEEFVFQNLSARYDEIRDISNQGGQENLSGALIKTIPFSYPDIDSGEQEIIANCLSALDGIITAQAQKIEDLKAHKKGLMQNLFPATDEVTA